MSDRRGPRRTRLAALAASSAVLLSACAPQGVTKTGEQVHTLYNIVLVMATVVFVGVEIAIVYNAIKYRHRKTDDDGVLPPQIHGSRNIEILWTAIPSVIVLALFVMSMKVLSDVNHEADCSTATTNTSCVALTVDVTGFQWQWSFKYGDGNGKDLGVTETAKGQYEPPTLVLPVGERIHFNLTSNDVIHSFFIPAFLFKRDVIPGHPNSFEVVIDPSKVGRYTGACAEFCGEFHNAMEFNVLAVKPSRFQSWLQQQKAQQAKAPSCTPNGTDLALAAQNIHYDTDCLAAPAGQGFTITFDNKDAGVPHNVAIFTDQTATKNLFTGTTVTGPTTTTYNVNALPAGTYFFRCDVHPTAMFGTFVVK